MPSAAKIIWRGDILLKQLRKAAYEGSDKAVDHLVTKCKEAVNEPYPPASIPGMPPHKRTGTGQDAIQKQSAEDDQTARLIVTEDGIHMLYLENGTRLVAPRPWLHPTVVQELGPMIVLIIKALLRVFK